MTKTELYTVLSTVAPTYFGRAEIGTAIPYIVYTWDYPNNFSADDKVYQRIATVSIQLYTNDPDMVDSLIAALDDLDVYWTASTNYELSEEVYLSTFDLEVIDDEG